METISKKNNFPSKIEKVKDIRRHVITVVLYNCPYDIFISGKANKLSVMYEKTFEKLSKCTSHLSKSLYGEC